ncbi:lipoprotein [Williamsoniiplasma luminosum]|uniref:Lipoprotein n=1 Tax=Williamsoniiplasma luminosum TaxID=214888 RepID=A0A2S0NJJ9_9MOLU|nr:lipoprotein [Williamsoniiplasma luminosum]AVP49200.1 MAG: hypothetical protein C5T88_01200 [Williamsoniiplasma luminosum]
MKKLLTLLGSISIVAAASATVVACSNGDKKPPNPAPDGKDEIRNLIETLKKDVQKNWNDKIIKPMAPRASFFQNDAESNDYNFFLKNNLKHVYHMSALRARIQEAETLLKEGQNKPDGDKKALADAIDEAKKITESIDAEKGLEVLEVAIEKFNNASTHQAIKSFQAFSIDKSSTPNLDDLKEAIKNAEETLKKGIRKPLDARKVLQSAIKKAIKVTEESEESQAEAAKKELENQVKLFNDTKDQEAFNFYNHITPTQRGELKANVEALLKPTELISELKKEISLSKYSVLLDKFGEKWIENINFNYQTAKIEYLKDPFTNSPQNETEQEFFLANISLDYSTKYNYVDAADATITEKLSGNINIMISDNEIWIDTISNVHKTLAAQLMKTGDDLVWIDKKDLEKTDHNNLKIDATDIIGNSDKYKAGLESYYIKKLIDKLPEKIVEQYFKNTGNPFLQNVTATPNSNIYIQEKSMNRKNELGAMNLQNIIITKLYGKDQGEIRNHDFERQKLYLGKVDDSVKEDWPYQDLADGSQAKNEYLYKDLQKTFENQKSQYETIFEKSYQDVIEPITKNKENKSNLKPEHSDIAKMKKRVVKHEQVTIEGISLKTSNGYSQKLNPLAIDLSVAVNKTSDNESSVNGYVFAAYYNGIKHNLDVFHRFYGMSPTDIRSSSTIPQKGLVFYMTGKPLGEDGKEIGFNIWDWWKDLPPNQGSRPNEEKESFLNATLTQAGHVTRALKLDINNDAKAKNIINQYLYSQMWGSASNDNGFKFNFYQGSTAPQGWNGLNKYTMADNENNGLKAGIHTIGNNSLQTIAFGIENDLFNIQIGEWKIGQAPLDTVHNDGNTEFTLIGKK